MLVAGPAASLALVAGFVVRLRLTQPLRVVRGFLYLWRVQNGPDPSITANVSGMTAMVVSLAVALALLATLYWHSPFMRLSSLPNWGRVGLGLVLGAGTANLFEIFSQGSVTDFVRVNGLGTFSVGDLEADLGFGLLAAAWWLIPEIRTIRPRPRRVLVAWTAAFLLLLLLSTVDFMRWAKVLSVVTVLGIAWLIAAAVEASQAASSSQDSVRL